MSIAKQIHPIRMLHVAGDSRFGGAATIILGLARVAREEGWQVEVLTTDPVFQQAVTQQGFGLVDLDVIRREIRPLWDLGGLFRLVRFLRREHYDIVHTHTTKGGFIGRLAARLAGVPAIVHTIHGFAFHESSPASVRVSYSALERLASYCCDRIVSVSEFHRDWAVRLRMCSPRKITAIPNGIAGLQPSRDVDSAHLRDRLGAGPGDLVILTVSRLAPDKGLEHLLQAVTTIAFTSRPMLFVIAGSGPSRDALERLAGELGVTGRVRFLGFRADVGDLLSACDLVVLPSVREGLSISLLEAMAAGKPIVATSIGSQREIASRARVAWLVPPSDSEALRNGIMQVTQDPALMSLLARNARALYERNYTEERMLQAYRSLYLDLPVARKNFRYGSIRPAAPDDLPEIVRIHRQAFSNFFLTRLGPAFLRRYYKMVLEYRSGILLVSEGRCGLRGFACGFVDPAEFYEAMWHARFGFAIPVLAALFRHPSLIGKVMSGVRRIHANASDWPARSCELSSIAVAPESVGNGLGKTLIEAFLERAESMDARCVYLTTDADGNDAVNAFYRNAGFHHSRRFLQGEARWMNEYVISRLDVHSDCRTVV